MSAIAHGWRPDHPEKDLPPLSVAQEFHAADKAKGEWEHAAGGEIESPLEQFTGSPLHSGRSMIHPQGIGYMTHLKMPYIPMSGVTRNVFAHLQGASAKLPKLQAKMAKMPTYKQKYAAGGNVQLPKDVIAAIQTAITHLANKDASSAAAVLHSSPVAMQHPVVAQAAEALRSGRGIGPASHALAGLVNQGPQGPRPAQR